MRGQVPVAWNQEKAETLASAEKSVKIENNRSNISNRIEKTKYRTNDQMFVEDRLLNYKKVYEDKVRKKNQLKTVDFFKPRVDKYAKSSRYVHVESKLPIESRVKRQRKSHAERRQDAGKRAKRADQVLAEADFSKKESLEGKLSWRM